MGIFDLELDLGDVVDKGASLLSEFITDKDEAARLAHEIATMGARHQHDTDLAQLKINEESAKHGSVFVAGARPAAIWVCVVSLAMLIVVYPAVIFFGQFWKPLTMPPIDTNIMWGVLSPLLGLGVFRTVEKGLGVARNKINERSPSK